MLGVDKDGTEWYQVTIGGEQGSTRPARIGKVIGPSFSAQEMPEVVARVIERYVENRMEGERFIERSPHRHGAVQGSRVRVAPGARLMTRPNRGIAMADHQEPRRRR